MCGLLDLTRRDIGSELEEPGKHDRHLYVYYYHPRMREGNVFTLSVCLSVQICLL